MASDTTRKSPPAYKADVKKDDEARLDEAVEETFPASDPIATGAGASPAGAQKPSAEDDTEKELDDALEDTFPASDPVSLTDPGHDRKK